MSKFNKINLVEGIDVEFKSNFEFENKSFIHKIYRTIRAFANTNGGKLLIGVNDKSEVIGIEYEEIDKIIRHLNDIFSKKNVELIANPFLHRNNKWYLEIYVCESKKFIYEDKQEKEICIRENSCLKILKGNDILDFWNKKNYCNKKINDFFKNCCGEDLMIDWRYNINESPNLDIKINKFCNFFKMFWLKTQTICFLNPERKHNFFNAIIGRKPDFSYFDKMVLFDLKQKTIKIQMDFFSLSLNAEKFSKHEIWSEKLGVTTHIYSGSIIFQIDKNFEIKEYFYKFDDELFENNIKNIKSNWFKDIDITDQNIMTEINKILELKIVENNKNFRKHSISYIVDEIKKIIKN